MSEMTDSTNPETVKRAMWAQSGMILDALRHTTDALDYLRMLKNQSVFVFCAIPAAMAIATLELCFMNPAMFQRNIKIRKAVAAKLIMRSKNPREVGLIFKEYARKIHAKATPTDPSFIRISVACGKIEQWCEHNYPSFVLINNENGTQSFEPSDPRTSIFLNEQSRDKQLIAKRSNGMANGIKDKVQQETSTTELMVYVLGTFGVIMGLSWMIILLVLKYNAEV
jgi:farnesyl-diphosphate farnesyltransferase